MSSQKSSGNSQSYQTTSSGVNQEGNHYCSRDYGTEAPNQNSYHYSNNDGSYYYSNPNGSTYHETADKQATYKSSEGESHRWQK
ncbi:hypothetical protein HKX48_005474 [Thoreauomyces humboldtii]|nr:hypothetical protein HKX48_005474 [Thoreauomyces humboldtii]